MADIVFHPPRAPLNPSLATPYTHPVQDTKERLEQPVLEVTASSSGESFAGKPPRPLFRLPPKLPSGARLTGAPLTRASRARASWAVKEEPCLMSTPLGVAGRSGSEELVSTGRQVLSELYRQSTLDNRKAARKSGAIAY